MRILPTVLKISMLSCTLFIAILGSSSGKNIMKGNVGKKPVTALENQPPPEFPSVIERLLNNIEKNIVSTAEAMPEDKFYFTPESLGLKGSEFKGVRTFAGQVKHLATDNFAIWSPVTGDSLRADITDVNGPESIKTKAEIIQYLKESFALGHKAIATLTEKNATHMIPFRGSNLPRLDLVFYALTHDNEHYGQMVVYLRMCGIIPPASVPAKK
jgi:uncharacterized damage-inducible protein DinB